MKINFQITTYILFFLLIISLIWGYQNQSAYSSSQTEETTNGTSMSHMMHQMPDGSMMMNTTPGMHSMMMDMNAQLRGKTGRDLEKAFLTEMIPHHEGAVDMAKMVLNDSTVTNEKIILLSKAILSTQNEEIEQMKEWLKDY